MEDERIVQLYWAREQDAIVQTEKKYGAKLHGYANQILKNKEDSEECVNDTYLKAWESMPPNYPRYLYAFLAKICRFLAFGVLDRKNAQKRKAQLVEFTEEMEMCIPAPAQELPMEQEVIGKLLSQFLGDLSKEKRMIFVRRYWYLDSIADISSRFQISESKVKTTLHRTREQLRKFLKKEGVSV